MAKKVVSVPLHKKKNKPVKRSSTRRKLKTIFRKIKKYMKSDNYMYSMLASEQSSVTLPTVSFVGESHESVDKKDKEWLEEVECYLKCDCYMYAPQVNEFSNNDEPSLTKDTSRNSERMEKRTDGATKVGRVASTPIRQIAVKHVITHHEAVKRVVQQSCGSSPAAGKVLLQKEPSETVRSGLNSLRRQLDAVDLAH